MHFIEKFYNNGEEECHFDVGECCERLLTDWRVLSKEELVKLRKSDGDILQQLCHLIACKSRQSKDDAFVEIAFSETIDNCCHTNSPNIVKQMKQLIVKAHTDIER